MFDFYHGGGLDLTCLGIAELQIASATSIPVSSAAASTGCGGFIDISQNARAVVFAGTFTAGGLEIAIEDGNLKIVKEGRSRQICAAGRTVTFSGRSRQAFATRHLRDRALRVPD